MFDALGLGPDSGPAGLILITLGVVVGVFALGTLIYTALAISIAPQVVMFVGLTHATFGLDHVRPGGDRDPDVPRAGGAPVPLADLPDAGSAFGFGVLGLAAVLAHPDRLTGSVDAELLEPVVVDAEVVGELVDDRHPDLVGEVVGVGEVLLERQPEEGDPVRDGRPVGAPFGPRDALVQAVQGLVRLDLVLAPLVVASVRRR